MEIVLFWAKADRAAFILRESLKAEISPVLVQEGQMGPCTQISGKDSLF